MRNRGGENDRGGWGIQWGALLFYNLALSLLIVTTNVVVLCEYLQQEFPLWGTIKGYCNSQGEESQTLTPPPLSLSLSLSRSLARSLACSHSLRCVPRQGSIGGHELPVVRNHVYIYINHKSKSEHGGIAGSDNVVT